MRDGGPRGESETHEALSRLSFAHLRLQDDEIESAGELLAALDSDVIFRQGQWDADIPEAFSTGTLRGYRLALIPYETMNPTVNVPWGDPPVNSAVDQAFHRAAWRIYVANTLTLEIAQRDSILGARQFRALGHPKLDALRHSAPSWPIQRREERSSRVLWSAHHSVLAGWNGFGLFPRVCGDMLDWARSDRETDFVFMHHPLLPDTLARKEHPFTLQDSKRGAKNGTRCRTRPGGRAELRPRPAGDGRLAHRWAEHDHEGPDHWMPHRVHRTGRPHSL